MGLFFLGFEELLRGTINLSVSGARRYHKISLNIVLSLGTWYLLN